MIRLSKKLNNLKVIYRLGKGLDNIDQNYAKKLNIKIYNTSVSLEKAVGELTVGLILNLVRKISIQDHNLKKEYGKKKWEIYYMENTLELLVLEK